MVRVALLLLLLLPAPVLAREVVDASAPEALSVTVYRDPERGTGALNPQMLNGFAMVSETRSVDLPAGPSTIRFAGIAEGMVGVSAIVTGLPGGTIEKNRNAALLSPGALVDGTLGNRVTISRTNPATGAVTSQPAIVRTRADGGLVLQTKEGFEAVGCSGLPEKLGFDRIPDGLSAQPTFSIDTNSPAAGRHRVTLTYIAAGFDWQANYLATLQPGGGPEKRRLRLVAWMTLANDNGQGFADATLLAVAGKINIESDFRDLSDPPRAEPLSLTCFGQPVDAVLPFMMSAPAMAAGEIIVTARRREESLQDTPVSIAMIANEEALGDLKLYRVPERITVAAKSLKQVAFLDRPDVSGEIIHRGSCSPWDDNDHPRSLAIALRTRNDAAHGLGTALPAGKVAVFEPGVAGDMLLGEQPVRDYASGQEVEIPLTSSSNVSVQCTVGATASAENKEDVTDRNSHDMRALLTNANNHTAQVEISLADSAKWRVDRTSARPSVHNGIHVLSIRLPANSSRTLKWRLRRADADAGQDAQR
ncbi:DUF4139 domain-containing protein [soil metagenome]